MSADSALGRAGLGSGPTSAGPTAAAPLGSMSAGLMALTSEQNRRCAICAAVNAAHYHRAAPAKGPPAGARALAGLARTLQCPPSLVCMIFQHQPQALPLCRM